MQFTSFPFVLFFTFVFITYWLIGGRNRVLQNLFLLVSSYFFYGWWNWKFLFLLFFVSFSNYLIGLLIQGSTAKKPRKRWFLLGLFINIAVLSGFKYLGFFIESFRDLLSIIGFAVHLPTLQIILPLGISFYIFLSISYLIDVYNNKFSASKNLADVLLTFSFFPIILAGPIQRPITLLPQIQTKRTFEYGLAVEGLRRILWGLFMKIVIADQCSVFVNEIFKSPNQQTASTLFFGGLYYCVQIYADFAGYSEIAIGVAALLGFRLMRNFSYPYFARDITDFWKRWHISLTMWFRDYVFLPIAYATSRKIVREKVLFFKTELIIYIIGISCTWLLTGIWHGSNWTFIAWGLIHATALIIYRILKSPRKKMLKQLKINNNNFFVSIAERILTLGVVFISFIVFRSANIGQAKAYLGGLFERSLFTMPGIITIKSFVLIGIFFLIEWLFRNKEYTLQPGDVKIPTILRWSFYYLIFISLFVFARKEQVFIYFQF